MHRLQTDCSTQMMSFKFSICECELCKPVQNGKKQDFIYAAYLILGAA